MIDPTTNYAIGSKYEDIETRPTVFHAIHPIRNHSMCRLLQPIESVIKKQHIQDNIVGWWPCGSCFPSLWQQEPWYSIHTVPKRLRDLEPVLESIEDDREGTNAEKRIIQLLTGTNDKDDNIQQILDDVAYHAVTRTYNFMKKGE